LLSISNENGWAVTGSYETCLYCTESNVRQKGVAKPIQTQSRVPCECLFMDVTSIRCGKYWLVVDNATSFTWSFFLTTNIRIRWSYHYCWYSTNRPQKKAPVKYIKSDNTGENKVLEKQCLFMYASRLTTM